VIAPRRSKAGKYFKVFRQEEEIPFGKTHNLIALLEFVMEAEQSGIDEDSKAKP
jgi:hypothetical protein